jgi:hypothetical protein
MTTIGANRPFNVTGASAEIGGERLASLSGLKQQVARVALRHAGTIHGPGAARMAKVYTGYAETAS